MENENQRRKRVVSGIKRNLLNQLADDLWNLAESGAFPQAWLGPREVNRVLDDLAYWLNHDNPIAPFLGPQVCEQLVEKALSQLTSSGSRVWWRDGDQFRSPSRDWQAQARETADRLRRECPGAERTAIHGGRDEASVIFGSNSSTADSRTNQQIATLRHYLKTADIPELAFSTSDDGQTWVMLVWSKNQSLLQNVLLAAWQAQVGSGAEAQS